MHHSIDIQVFYMTLWIYGGYKGHTRRQNAKDRKLTYKVYDFIFDKKNCMVLSL